MNGTARFACSFSLPAITLRPADGAAFAGALGTGIAAVNVAKAAVSRKIWEEGSGAAARDLLRFIARHVANPRHSRQLAGVTARVLDIYGGEIGASKEVDAALRRVRDRVAHQIKLQGQLAGLGGVAAPLLAAGSG